MSTTEQILPPPVMWAQRKNAVLLTICLEDCKDASIKMEPRSVHFKGTSGSNKKPYEVTLDLYGEIDAENSKSFVRDRSIELILRKKEEGPYWPHLMKDKKKYHWLKVDFNRWRDEDDSEPEGGEDQDFEEMMRQMGGLGGGENPSLNDLDDEDLSDEGDMPDLE